MKQAKFLLTSIALLLCSITISAHDFEVDGIYYNITSSTDNTVQVTHKEGTYGGYAKSVTIPTRVTYNGKTYEVTSIGYEAFYRCSRLTSIEIPNSVTSIGEYAFEDCYSLTSIEIPNSVTSIGNYAFYGCSNLKNVINNSSLNITKGSSSFGYIAYYADRVLSGDYVDGFIFDGEDGDYILTYYLGNETNLVLPVNYMEQSYRIGDYAFYGCSSLTSIDLPDGLTSIGYAAFYKCSSLTSIDLPDGLTSIGDWAFGSCSSLTSIEIPNSVTSIGDYAFLYCSNLKIVINNSNLNITKGSSSFGYIAYYADRVLLSGDYVDGFIFDGEDGDYILTGYLGNETNLVLPDNYMEQSYRIGNNAFDGCSSLTNIEIPNSVTSIGNYAFRGCSSLTSIEIPNSVTSIGHRAFEGCSSLTSIEIPNSVTSIGSSAFYGCSSLTEIKVTPDNPVYDSRDNCNAVIRTKSNTLIAGCASTIIPSSVTSIGNGAFKGCSSLTSIEIPNSVTSIGSSAFEGCSSLTSIEIPNSVTSIGSWAFSGCSNLDYFSFGKSVKSIGNDAFYGCSSLTSIEIPNSVTSIGPSAFNGCSGLTSIEIPNSVTSIGDWAFSGCSNLDYFSFGKSVKSIGNAAFHSCSSLTSIEIPNSVTSIGSSAFYGCSSLTSIEIPNSVTSIGSFAFSGCSNLDYFSFGKSVKSIGQKAFSGCVNLKKLISYAEVPPTCDTNALDDINKRECTLQIPENTLSAYQSANQWKDFFFIEDVLSEIGGVTINESQDTRVDVYSINGQLIKRNADAKQLSKELPTGIYIINGKKVYVR